jgi:hypothetical protein
MGGDEFDISQFRLGPEDVQKQTLETRAKTSTPMRLRKQRESFIKVPGSWLEKLAGSSGATYHVALVLLHENWRLGGPVTLPNGMLKMDGISRHAKYRALVKLENLGLITVERRLKKSPRIKLHMSQKHT